MDKKIYFLKTPIDSATRVNGVKVPITIDRFEFDYRTPSDPIPSADLIRLGIDMMRDENSAAPSPDDLVKLRLEEGIGEAMRPILHWT